MSEEGFLHYKISFDLSIQSTGSAPASRRDGSSLIGSASSLPSTHFLDVRAVFLPTDVVVITSIHQASHWQHLVTLKTDLLLYQTTTLANHHWHPLNIGSPPCAHASPDKTSTIKSLGSNGSGSVASVTAMDENSFGPVMGLVRLGSKSQMSIGSLPLNAPPLAGIAGLDNDWVPAT